MIRSRAPFAITEAAAIDSMRASPSPPACCSIGTPGMTSRPSTRISSGATLRSAMERAIALLRVAPELILVDGLDVIPGVPIEQQAGGDGDARMLSIAAASVMAKGARDRIMERPGRGWPGSGSAQHRGYGTREHLAIPQRLGRCPIPGYSYSPVAFQELPFGALPALELTDPPRPAPPAAAMREDGTAMLLA